MLAASPVHAHEALRFQNHTMHVEAVHAPSTIADDSLGLPSGEAITHATLLPVKVTHKPGRGPSTSRELYILSAWSMIAVILFAAITYFVVAADFIEDAVLGWITGTAITEMFVVGFPLALLIAGAGIGVYLLLRHASYLRKQKEGKK
jgi:disulfide bond formation protein DsbB